MAIFGKMEQLDLSAEDKIEAIGGIALVKQQLIALGLLQATGLGQAAQMLVVEAMKQRDAL